MKPKEFLISYVEKFNAGDISSLIALYETNACFVSQPGQVLNGLENIRQALQTFVDMKGKLETKVNGVIQTSDIALVYSE
jgi:ketosteroid isomerase-like protein